MSHIFNVRVYYEDTDLAGIVYYANYLKFIERARTEYVRSLGIDQGQLKTDEGLVFAVRHVEADYIAPARFDDDLRIETIIDRATGARLVMRQTVTRGEQTLFAAVVTIVALSLSGQPVRLPAKLRAHLH